MNKRRIILGMPKHNNIVAEIKKNLEYHGYDVTFIDSNPDYVKKFKYQNNIDRLYHAFRKIFYHDKSYKHQLKEKFVLEQTDKYLAKRQYDYSLIIRPDTYSLNLLQLIRSYTCENMVGYQWDGLNRFPDVMPIIDLFDNFFVFDADDTKNINFINYHLKGITNFYFDMYQPEPVKHNGKIAYFIGSHIDERISAIDCCAYELNKNNIKLKFIIPTDDNTKILKYEQKDLITFGSKNKIEFYENICNINNSDILIDIVNPIHNGLSFRVFEALYYRKKLITNNLLVQKYDFYHPHNIFILGVDDLTFLPTFLADRTVEIDPQIVKKYSFGNWIRNILNIKPFQLISLP
ncbi:MAG: hypothetical protein J6582_09505 [Snodgrassella sp.]|uniref:hypothetical protein n=1 Tax=Snodgrassella sp. TaxID=2815304 RepID=UPI002587882D|nr:hypothetical protein [Snodgrassella sp.]MCO6521263.1 hypothetical protein [Snodgrassella sp.]MCO6526854.1 hypothetical protein [Snodgrassella sp.]